MRRTDDIPDAADAADAADAPVPVWDLPTRLFHWGIVVLFGLSWWSAEYNVEQVHLWSGQAFLFALIFRILWGVAGSSTARFAGFVRGPRAVADYVRGGWRAAGVGHSPLGALSVVAMLLLLLAQVGLGLFAADDDGVLYGPLSGLVSIDATERALDLHETLFSIVQLVILVHILAIAFYWIVLKRGLVGPMVRGTAALGPETIPMRPAARGRAAVCALAALAITAWIAAGAPPFGP